MAAKNLAQLTVGTCKPPIPIPQPEPVRERRLLCGRCGERLGVIPNRYYGRVCADCAEWLRLEQGYLTSLEREASCYE